jgi:hypothetical protein
LPSGRFQAEVQEDGASRFIHKIHTSGDKEVTRFFGADAE